MVSSSPSTSVGMFSYQTYLFLAMCYLQVRLSPPLLLPHSSLCFPHKSHRSPRRVVRQAKAFLHQSWLPVVKHCSDTREPRDRLSFCLQPRSPPIAGRLAMAQLWYSLGFWKWWLSAYAKGQGEAKETLMGGGRWWESAVGFWHFLRSLRSVLFEQ